MPNKSEKFSDSEIGSKLGGIPGWSYDSANARIERLFTRKNFLDAVTFIQQIATIAEAQDHHPDLLLFGYNQVKVMLATHSAGGITAHDFELASAINKLIS